MQDQLENPYERFSHYLDFGSEPKQVTREISVMDLIEEDAVPELGEEWQIEYQEIRSIRTLRTEYLGKNQGEERDDTLQILKDDADLLRTFVSFLKEHWSQRRVEEKEMMERMETDIGGLTSQLEELSRFAPGYKPSIDFLKQGYQREIQTLEERKRQRKTQLFKDEQNLVIKALEAMRELSPKARLEKMLEMA